MKLSARQENVLREAGHGALVLTAAAGSGKTAVLVERVVRYLEQDEGASLSRVLIVTFTDKAAEEMRARLGQALIAGLSDPDRWEMAETQLALLPRAWVETFHAFGNRLISQYGHTIGSVAQLAVVDPVTQTELWQDAWQEAARAYPEQRRLLARHWDERTQPLTRQALSHLIGFARSMPDPEGFLERIGTEFTDPRRLDSLLNELTADLGRQADQWRRQVERLCASPIADATLATAAARLSHALAALAGGGQGAVISEILPKRMVGLNEGDRAVLDQLRKIVKTAEATVGNLAASTVPGSLAAEAQVLAPVASAASELSAGWLRAYQGLKRQRRLIDYDDQLQMAYQILTSGQAPSAVAKELAVGLDLLLVDEYQDTNPLQDALLARLLAAAPTPPNLLVVGDGRQSIYRFRHAEPELLQTLADRLPTQGRRLEMAENFRSRKEILDGVQAVTGEFPGIEGAAALVAARDRATYPDARRPLVEVWVVESDRASEDEDDDDQELWLSRPEAEAAVIGRSVSRWCADKEMVFDRRLGLRPIQPSDVAVLVRSAESVHAFQEVFGELGLATQVRAGRKPHHSLEWQTMESLVAVAAGTCTEQDLATVLRSPIVAVGLDQLTDMAKGGEGGLLAGVRRVNEQVAQRIETWQSWRWLPVGEMVGQLMEETGYMDLVLPMANGGRRHDHLLAFLDWADAYSQGWSGGPQAFVEATRAGAGDAYHARPEQGTKDAVQLLTIHQAKGLEFPVVVLAGAGVALPLLTHRRQAPYLGVHRELGVGLLTPDPARAVRRLTPLATGIELAVAREAREEEARLLYVAMTRAQDRLVLVGTVRDQTAALVRWRAASGLTPAGRWRDGRSYLDWAAPVALQDPATLSLSWPHPDAPGAFLPPTEERAANSGLPSLPELWDERLPLPEAGAPEVVTATSLVEDEAETELESRAQSVGVLPRAASLQPAAIGTASHLLLAHLDYPTKDAVPEIERQCRELVQAGVLSAEEAGHIDIPGLAALFSTPIGKRLAAAPERVQREVPFTLLAEEGTPLAGSLLHGQIDVLFVADDAVVVVDLKTDRISKDDLARRAAQYGPQMHSYRRAIRALFAERPVTVALYFSHVGALVVDSDLNGGPEPMGQEQ